MKTLINPGRITSLLLGLLTNLASCSEETFNPSQSESFAIQSAGGASYTITVALPDKYNSAQTYSALYLLDGEEDFDFVARKCNEISGNHAASNVLVVSIGYGNDRALDYTPTKTGSDTGGAPEFMEFIETLLIPSIEHRYSVDTTRAGRIILGHSYGGLFGTYAFATHNEVFGNYILLSPSLWFDDLVTLQYEKENRAANALSDQLVFLGQGELENAGKMQAPFEAFYQILQKNYPGISLGKHLEYGLDHMGSKHPNIILGLNHYFENRNH